MMPCDCEWLLLLLQAVLLRDACLSEVYAYEVLERAAAA
jgi:hypothetical protein